MTESGELLNDPAPAPLAAGPHAAVVTRLPSGADPDAVRDWFEFETIVELPMPAMSFAEAEAAAADYRRAARAENTRRAYRAAVARFTDWCHEHRQTALPAAPETVAAFLAAEAGRGLAVNTLGCAMPRCAICISSLVIRRQLGRHWCRRPLPAFAAPTAGRCARRPHSCWNHCAPRSGPSLTPCRGGATAP